MPVSQNVSGTWARRLCLKITCRLMIAQKVNAPATCLGITQHTERRLKSTRIDTRVAQT